MPQFNDKSEGTEELQIEEDIQYFRRTLSIQYGARIVVFILLLAACIGLFGTGFLSNRTIKQDAFQLQYEYFMRRENKTEIVLHQNESEAVTVVRFPADYIKHFVVEETIPEPHFTAVGNGYVDYVFQTAGTSTIRLFISAEDFGFISGDLLINDKKVHLHHFIYP